MSSPAHTFAPSICPFLSSDTELIQLRRDMKIAFGCAVCVFTVAVCVFLGWPYGRGKHLFRHFHPDTQRLLSIYAFHREIGLNAYVKDPIKVARRTPCDVSIAPGKPSTHMPRFPGWPRPNVVANPLSKSYQRFSSLRREVENFLRVETNEKKFNFQFGNFFRMLWESLHTSRRLWSFAFFVFLPTWPIFTPYNSWCL